MAGIKENLYLEVTNACPHACVTCPHGTHHRVDRPFFTPVAEACAAAARAMAEKNVGSVTISGGEPLLHPQIVELCSRLKGMGLRLTMLSNLQLLADQNLGPRLYQADPDLTVVTALHSADAESHDAVTRHPGSHAAALRSIDQLVSLGMRTVIKVILSVHTCQRLKEIIAMAFGRWGKQVQFNFCGMDLCGADEETLQRTPVHYASEGPLLEEALDTALQRYGDALGRYVRLTEYPLCFLDPYFWPLSHRGASRMTAYIREDRLNTADTLRPESTCDTHAFACRRCVAQPLCPGFWHSVYRLQGEACVRPYLKQDI